MNWNRAPGGGGKERRVDRNAGFEEGGRGESRCKEENGRKKRSDHGKRLNNNTGEKDLRQNVEKRGAATLRPKKAKAQKKGGDFHARGGKHGDQKSHSPRRARKGRAVNGERESRERGRVALL